MVDDEYCAFCIILLYVSNKCTVYLCTLCICCTNLVMLWMVSDTFVAYFFHYEAHLTPLI